MKNTINVAIQILPQSETMHPYSIVDKAIEVIQKSGLKYIVCPFETVIEGEYDSVMKLVKEVQEACLEFGTESLITNLKIQLNNINNVTIEDKMEKYS